MKGMWGVIAAMLFCVCCDVQEISRRPGLDQEDVWYGPGISAGDSGKEVCYVTAMSYPEDYDWRADRERGSVRCSLTVFADGLPVMKVPVGDAYEVSADPDMHRMIEGYLYTDYSTDSETVIKRDGRTVLRYAGREIICGIITEGDDIYTLGHPRKGTGLTYRRNGQVILERPHGRTFGRLYRDRDSICFDFIEPVISDEAGVERYYHVRNGRVSQEALREDVRKVWDMMSVDGEVCYVASVTGVEEPVLYQGGSLSALILPEDGNLLNIRIMPCEGNLFFEGVYTSPEVGLSSVLWPKLRNCIEFDDGMTMSSVCVCGDGICCAVNPSVSMSPGYIYRFGDFQRMPEGYTVIGKACTAVARGMLHVGLSSADEGRPMIWKDGEIKLLDINGFVASVSVY